MVRLSPNVVSRPDPRFRRSAGCKFRSPACTYMYIIRGREMPAMWNRRVRLRLMRMRMSKYIRSNVHVGCVCNVETPHTSERTVRVSHIYLTMSQLSGCQPNSLIEAIHYRLPYFSSGAFEGNASNGTLLLDKVVNDFLVGSR